MAIVTIARELGTYGEEIGSRLAGKLGFMLIDKDRIEHMKTEYGFDDMESEAFDEQVPSASDSSASDLETSIRMVPALLADLAEEFNLVIIGRGGQCIFKDSPGVLHIYLCASPEFRIRAIREQYRVSHEEALRKISESDRERSNYIRHFYNSKWNDLELYDCILKMDMYTIEYVVNLIENIVQNHGLTEVPKLKIIEQLTAVENSDIAPQGFEPYANESEVEFARFLKYYDIPFQYEPRTFILETDEDGKVGEAFTPDFYFPEQDLYIELTTLQQSLVTRKNRKIRKLRQLYPDVSIRIFYRKDFNKLLTKFGIAQLDNQRKQEN